MRRNVLIEFIKSILGKKNIYKRFYDRNDVIYIHIPKTAGTSICNALYEGDPWHYSAKELNFIQPIKFKKYAKVAFVRDPLERLISTYNYSLQYVKENPKCSIAFMSNARNFDEFIELYFTENLIKEHYFFWKQAVYLDCEMDFIGKFENLQDDFYAMKEKFKLNVTLLHHNKSLSFDKKIPLKESNLKKIFLLYSDDYKKFGYLNKISSKISITNNFCDT